MWRRQKREPRARFAALDTVDGLERAIAESSERPVIIYLHDPYCGLNSVTLRRVEAVDREIWLVDVSVRHDVKRAVEARTGVRHASPQVIVLRDGRVAWHASHLGITQEGIERALAAAGRE
ncbi:MAG: hypothetical protein Kow0010_26670 [Dehalococcoidia bacterium]